MTTHAYIDKPVANKLILNSMMTIGNITITVGAATYYGLFVGFSRGHM